VLGRVKTEPSLWQWGAYGKQPWVKDYFKVGAAFPLMNGFADWIEKGFGTVASRSTAAERQHSWRFWARDSRQDHVICGVVKDSADALGRPYPFLIIGTGPLEGWGRKWDLLSFVFTNVWGQAEYLSTCMYGDPRVFEVEVSSIIPPVPEWSAYEQERDRLLAGPPEPGLSVPQFSGQQTEGLMGIDDQTRDHESLVALCHREMRKSIDAPPNAVFMGGTTDQTYFAHFRRPLNASDFVQLWGA
jgi:type VI secretion system protein VasJ